MEQKTKILIFTVNSWNNVVGDNTWETLIKNYKSENIANIYLRDEQPNSKACDNYFCISENRIIKSFVKRWIKTGRRVDRKEDSNTTADLIEHQERYRKMKKHRRYSALLARELVWKLGKWKTKELNSFLDDFKPDIILHGMDGYIHMNRIVRYAIKRTRAKAVGYIWDDNFTYNQSKKLGYKIYRFFQRKSLKKLAKQTDKFFAITPKTKQEADSFFGISCQLLSKPLNSIPQVCDYNGVEKPLKMLYTGNLLIGREETLKLISKELQSINADEPKILLDVYTQTEFPEEKKQEIINDFCKIHPAISQEEVLQKQKEADVLLFLEDLSVNNLTARLSFSTKITDYFSTGKCIFAVGNEDLAPIEYFKETDSAIVVTNRKDIKDKMDELTQNSATLYYYACKAAEIGINNHSEELILKTFEDTIDSVYKED